MGDIDFRELFESSPDVLLVLEPDAPRYTMVAATRARYAATNTTPSSLGRGIFEQFPDDPNDPDANGTANLRASLDRVCAARMADTMPVQKYNIRKPDGTFEVRYWSPKNIPVLGQRGDVRYILHRVEDVTELVRAGETSDKLRDRTSAMEREVLARSRELADAVRDLREANKRLGELDAAKTTFFSNISHEFRTPLTLMLGPLEESLAERTEPLGPLHKRHVELAHRNALRLLKLVNTLLDFSKLEAGRAHAKYVPTDVASLTAELAGMFESAIARAGVKLTIDCPSLTEPVWVDRDMWEKIIPNLVSNAIKFTFAGEISVRVVDGSESITVEVADTGVGIPEEEQALVFERFYRIAGARGRSQEGTGIGLALVRELVELHGGRVRVTSRPGAGTTFSILIPRGFDHLPPELVGCAQPGSKVRGDLRAHVAEVMRWSASASPPEDTSTSKALPRVLVVDDNADLRDYMHRLLSPEYEVMVASDGLAGVEAARALVPDIVVSDVMMPGLDGFGLVRALRADPSTQSIPIILLSARAEEEASIQGLDAGADDYLAKPFSARELLARVRTHVGLAEARRAWTEELERANRELDAFSYSVSHDLSTPATQMHMFAELLKGELGPELPSKASRFLDNILQGSRDMLSLIAHLFRLSKLGQSPLTLDNVDLSDMARSIVASRSEASLVSVRIAAGLRAIADPGLVRVVLDNLLGNAFKYASKHAAPVVTFDAVSDPSGETIYFVRDNGVGFDASQASRLFIPFSRLHSQEEFPGSGIGLSTVRRIVQKHGGRIWAESAPGEGATFYFTLCAHHAARPPLLLG